MKRQNRIFAHGILSCALTIMLLCGQGCGSGSSSPLPNNLQPMAHFSGQVLLPTQGRAASAESDAPVGDAEVGFYPDGINAPSFTTTTDDQGFFTLQVTPGKKGRLVAVKGNGRLEAIVDAVEENTQLSRSITVESTLVSILQKENKLGGADPLTTEEFIRNGQIPESLQEIALSFKENRTLSISQTLLGEVSDMLIETEEITRNSCDQAQQWCVIVQSLEASQNSGQLKAKILLRKLGHSNDATVGAGSFSVQWPSGIQVQTISPAPGLLSPSALTKTRIDPTGNSTFAFVIKTPKGLSATTPLFEVALTGSLPQNVAHTATVRDQRLRGVLSESRSSARLAAVTQTTVQ